MSDGFDWGGTDIRRAEIRTDAKLAEAEARLRAGQGAAGPSRSTTRVIVLVLLAIGVLIVAGVFLGGLAGPT